MTGEATLTRAARGRRPGSSQAIEGRRQRLRPGRTAAEPAVAVLRRLRRRHRRPRGLRALADASASSRRSSPCSSSRFFLTLALNPLVESWSAAAAARRSRWPSCSPGWSASFVAARARRRAAGGRSRPASWPRQRPELPREPAPATASSSDLDQHYHVVDKIQAELRQADHRRQLHERGLRRRARRRQGGRSAGVFSALHRARADPVLPRVAAPRQAGGVRGRAGQPPRRGCISLSEEIMRRVGCYAIGQVAVAAINALCAWIMMTIVGIPYAAVLAVAVGFLGLVPMVGATLGAVARLPGRAVRRPDEGGHRARLLRGLPADRELRRRAADHAAHGRPCPARSPSSPPSPAAPCSACSARCWRSRWRPACCCSTRRCSSPGSAAA